MLSDITTDKQQDSDKQHKYIRDADHVTCRVSLKKPMWQSKDLHAQGDKSCAHWQARHRLLTLIIFQPL